MKIQLALDAGRLEDLMDMAGRLAEYFDWVEAGTPLILRSGVQVVARLRERFPDKVVVADMKIVDGGGPEARMACEAGADIITVMAGAADETIRDAVAQAHQAGVRIMVDLLDVVDKVQRACEVEALGVDLICVHTSADRSQVGQNGLQGLAEIKQATRTPLVVAGGIDGENIKPLIAQGVHAAIVGRAITGSQDPVGTARQIRGQANPEGAARAREDSTGETRARLPRNITEAANLILAELAEIQPEIDTDAGEALVQALAGAKRVFVYGAGRSGLMVRALASRLAHLGIPTYILGEIGVPPLAAEDLFLVASSSGETATPLAAARRARELGIPVAAVTSRPDSSLAQLADPVVILTSRKGDMPGIAQATSRQPMGSLVEQSTLLFFDAIVLRLMDRMGQTSRVMHARHANIE